MRMCWPSESRQPCSAFSCIAVTTASPSGMMRDAGMAALPFQPARRVGLGAPRTTARRRCNATRRPLALRVEHEAGDGRGMLQRLQLRAPRVEHMHVLADRAGEQSRLAVGEARDMLHPFRRRTAAIVAPRRRRRCGETAPSSPPVTKPPRRVRRQREHRAVMHRDVVPFAGSARAPSRSVPSPERERADRAPARDRSARGDHECVQLARGRRASRAGSSARPLGAAGVTPALAALRSRGAAAGG